MDPQSAGSSSGSGQHNYEPPRSSKEEAAQLRAAIQASLADVDLVEIGEEAYIADSDMLQSVVTDAAESASLHSAAELEELAQHEAALDKQNEDSTNAEPDMSLGNEAGMTTLHSERSEEHYIPWFGDIMKLGKICVVSRGSWKEFNGLELRTDA
jgi:hypothetical protein